VGIPGTCSPFLGVVGLVPFSSVSVGLVSLSSEHKIGRSSSMGWANAKLCGLMVVARHDLMFISWCSAIFQSQNFARHGCGPLQTGRCPAPPVLGLVSVSLGVVGLVSLSSLGFVSVSFGVVGAVGMVSLSSLGLASVPLGVVSFGVVGMGVVGLVSLSSEHNKKATAVCNGWQ